MTNVRGGNKYKKTKSNRQKAPRKEEHIDLNNGEGHMGRVIKILGGKRIEVEFLDQMMRPIGTGQACIMGRMYKKIWIKPDNYILMNNDYEIVKVLKSEEVKRFNNNDEIIFDDEYNEEVSEDEKIDINELKIKYDTNSKQERKTESQEIDWNNL